MAELKHDTEQAQQARDPAASRDAPEVAGPVAVGAALTRSAALDARQVRRLQRSAGNAAVGTLLTAPRREASRAPGSRPVVQRQDGPGLSLDERYRAALRSADQTGDYREAAALLNGFSRVDVLARLAQLSDTQVSYLHVGAVGNPAVGPDSQVAQLTVPGAPRASTVEPPRTAGPAPSPAPGPSPSPAPATPAATSAIALMSGTQRLVEAFNRARINEAVRARILAAFTPETFVAAVLSFAVAFAVSQLTPVGWAADFALAMTIVFVGTALLRATQHLVAFADARNATSEEDLDRAGQHFAEAVAEIEIDTILLLLTRAFAPAAGAGGAPPPPAGVVIAVRGGQLAVVAVDMVPVAVATQAGIAGGALMSAASGGGGGRDDDYWEDTYGEDEPAPRQTRISDGNKQELEDTGWLRRLLPDAARRREFMEWLQRGHEIGEEHVHLRPGSPEAEQAVREFLLENP